MYPSHRVTKVKSAPWVALFKWYHSPRIRAKRSLGEEHMIDLLLNTSIYISVKNDFYTQLTGILRTLLIN